MSIIKKDDKTLEETTTVVKEYTLENLQSQQEDIEAEIAYLQEKLDKVKDLLKQF